MPLEEDAPDAGKWRGGDSQEKGTRRQGEINLRVRCVSLSPRPLLSQLFSVSYPTVVVLVHLRV
jgi:hypothetical protein